jgi:radical SAM superfamily enzyme YgiQ (UPF0313 family)
MTAMLPAFIEAERGYNPPLGLLFVATSLIKNSDHNVMVFDAQVEEYDSQQVGEIIIREKPDVICLTVMTFTLIDCLKVAGMAKKIDSKIKVVFGGPHVNIYPNETIALPDVDFIVLGEGEEGIVQLIDNIDDPGRLQSIPGFVFKYNKGKVVNTGPCRTISDLDSLPFPDRRLTPYKKYTSVIAKHNPITTMITSRGCPYKCLFCDRPHLGKAFRARGAANVVAEFAECAKLGINEILIYDDTFTVDRQRVVDICQQLIAGRFDIAWDIRARVNTVDEQLLRLLKKAGCERIHYGIEAGNQKILNNLRKAITLDQAKRAVELTHKAGIQTLAYFMIGSPGETVKTIQETIDFAIKINPGFVHFGITTPFPGTDLYRLGLQNKVIKTDYWQDYAANPREGFIPKAWEENLTKAELSEQLMRAYKSFYGRPRFILKELFKVNSFGEFKRKAKAGLRMLGM